MKRLIITVVICAIALLAVSISRATANLNSSKSNIYQVVFDSRLVSQAQGDAMVKELDKLGPVDETQLKQWLAQNFKTFGIDGSRVKEIAIFLQQRVSCAASADSCKGKWKGPALNARGKGSSGDCFCYEGLTTPAQVRRVNKSSPILIVLLSNLSDLPQGLAVSDPGVPGDKGGSKPKN